MRTTSKSHSHQGQAQAYHLAVLLMVIFSERVFGQTPDTFNPGADGVVYVLAPQPDGQILVGGDFGTLGGQAHARIGRVSADGIADSNFSPGANNGVYALAVQRDGKFVVGGAFTSMNGTTRNRLARLNADGTLDTSFNPNANDTVWGLAVQADGKILVGGYFTRLAGQARNHIARLNPDGTLDTGFDPGADSGVYCFSIQANGKILVGGDFRSLGGMMQRGAARLNADGTVDTSFNPGVGGYVNCFVEQADGRICMGGQFSSLGGIGRNNFGRVNADGTLDTSFLAGYSGTVESILLQADGRIIVCGLMNGIRRWNADGIVDPTFKAGTVTSVYSLALQPDGKVLVGGQFSSIGGQSRRNLGRLTNPDAASEALTFDGTSLTWLRGGASPELFRTQIEFSTNGVPWIDIGPAQRTNGGWQLSGLGLPTNASVRARGYVAGGLHHASICYEEKLIGDPVWAAQPVSRTNNAGTVARFSVLDGAAAPLSCQWLKNGALLRDMGNISGTQSPTLTISNVLGADGGGYSAILSNASGTVTSLVAYLTVVDPIITNAPASKSGNPGDTVTLSVGVFGTGPFGYQWRKDGVSLEGAVSESLSLTNIQRSDAGMYDVVVSNAFGSAVSAAASLTVNVATADLFAPGGCDGPVYSLGILPDGKVLVAGEFSTLAGATCTNLGRLYADGALDTNFNAGANGAVYGLAVQPDGKLVVAGSFSLLGGVDCPYVGRFMADGTLDTTFHPRPDGAVFSLALQNDGKILIGGTFQTLDGQARTNLGRLNADGSVDSSFNVAADQAVNTLALQPDGKILVGGGFTILGGLARSSIGRLNPDGTVDVGFNAASNGKIYAVAVQADGRILAGGVFTSMGGFLVTNLARLNLDGTLDRTFVPGPRRDVYALALQTDGKILVGGYFFNLGGQSRTCLGRLNPDGTADTLFNAAADSGYGVRSLAIQPDGRILVGGEFGTLAGQSSANLGRLNNTDPVSQSLGLHDSSVLWLRGGPGPEVGGAVFEISTNGSEWLLLGTGTRVSGGWQLGGLSLPANPLLRVRGFVSGGGYSGSPWLVEMTAQVATEPWPLILVNEPGFGFSDGAFGFNVSMTGGQAVVIEGSTDLHNWLPVYTNTASGDRRYFSDPDCTNFMARFYRARLQ